MRTNQIKAKVTPTEKTQKVLMQTYVDEGLAKSFQALVKTRGGLSAREVMREALQNEVQRHTMSKPVKELTVAQLGMKVQNLQDQIATQEAHIRLQTALLRSICQAVGVSNSI